MLQTFRAHLVPQRAWGLSMALLLLRLCLGIGLFEAGTGKLHKLAGECAEDPLPDCEKEGQATCGDDAACKTKVPAACTSDRKAACVAKAQKSMDFFADLKFFDHEGWQLPGGGKLNMTLTAVQETLFGLLIALGLLARLSSVPALVIMFVACTTAHWKAFHSLEFASEMAFAYFAMAAVLLATGPGRLSLDALLATPASGQSAGKPAKAKKTKAT